MEVKYPRIRRLLPLYSAPSGWGNSRLHGFERCRRYEAGRARQSAGRRRNRRGWATFHVMGREGRTRSSCRIPGGFASCVRYSSHGEWMSWAIAIKRLDTYSKGRGHLPGRGSRTSRVIFGRNGTIPPLRPVLPVTAVCPLPAMARSARAGADTRVSRMHNLWRALPMLEHPLDHDIARDSLPPCHRLANCALRRARRPSSKHHSAANALFFAMLAISLPIASAASDCRDWDRDHHFSTVSLPDVERCLESWIDARSRYSPGYTPLHMASKFSKNPAVIAALLNAGVEPDARARDTGETPLHLAARYSENPAVIVALVDAGANPNLRRGWSGDTPLHLAAGGDPDGSFVARSEFERRSLHGNSNPEIAIALLEAGADPTKRDKRGDTPLHRAARHGRFAFNVEALLRAGADLKATTDLEKTPLHLAAEHNKEPAIIGVLLRAGADANARDSFMNCPLHVAVGFESSPTTVEALLMSGADVHARNVSTESPLHIAAKFSSDVAVIEALLRAGADVNVTDQYKRTPLHEAAEHNDEPAIVEALTRSGADVNALDNFKRTPLHVAAFNGTQSAVLEALLDAGAQTTAQDNGGRTPWDLLARNRKLRGTEVYWRMKDEQ